MKTILALIGLGLVAISGNVFAAINGKTFPGAMCQPTSGDAVRFFMDGSVNTDPNSGHHVNCPVVRDTMAEGSDSGGVDSASITVRDHSPTEDVVCTFKSLAHDGRIVVTSTVRTSGSNTEPQVLRFGTIGSAALGGNYVIQCRIPKATPPPFLRFSSIISYRVDENE